MQIYVCVKHVPDSAATIRITGTDQYDESVIHLMNPYDEHAVEESLRLKERVGDSEVIAVTQGKEKAEHTLRTAMAMGADRGLFIKTDRLPDSIMTARALQAAIEQDGPPDIIFTGRESIDAEGMQTMFRLAAGLGIPVVSNVVELELIERAVRIEREVEAGEREVIEMPLPCVIGTGKGLNTPRYIGLPGIMAAKKKPIKQIVFDSLNNRRSTGSVEIIEFRPALDNRKGLILKGNPEEAVERLVRILTEEEKVF